MNGAATNPDCHVVAFAGAQVKKGLDIAKKLGAENFGMTPLCHCVLKYPHTPSVPQWFYPIVSLSPQCFGEEGKVSSLSIILMSPLN